MENEELAKIHARLDRLEAERGLEGIHKEAAVKCKEWWILKPDMKASLYEYVGIHTGDTLPCQFRVIEPPTEEQIQRVLDDNDLLSIYYENVWGILNNLGILEDE